MKQFLKFSCALAILTLITSIKAQNIVVDPGFENAADSTSGNPFVPPWVINDPSGNSDVGGNPSFAHSGNNYANLGTAFTLDPNSGFSTGTLSQTLATIAGVRYTLSFWLASDVAAAGNSFQAMFGGSLVFATPLMSPPFPSDGAYHQFIFTNLLATSNSTLLQFQFRNDQDFWRLDDVSVAAPEGGVALWLALPVLGGMCLLHSRIARSRRLLAAKS